MNEATPAQLGSDEASDGLETGTGGGSASASNAALLADLADEFARRWRGGERPSVDEYARRYPELAREILDTFPAIAAMERPGLAATLDLFPSAERVGSIIGRYKLLERIGEGGYGTVFMAEQTHPVKRKVALKVIKAGMDTRQVIARFEAERQALALMDHENIARVLDAGATDSGRPYFVMELVKGVPITRYCDEHRLTPRQRLELFVRVCHAVQHAHQKGIIHRDLKPSNVLVALYDGRPVPKVIDFGVAKATGPQLTERTMFTGFGDVIGTPQYMSPEQAELNQLDIDTRSDIYCLGVLLYELLAGSTPIEHRLAKDSALLEVLRRVREEEPPKPSARLNTSAALPAIAAQRGVDPKKLSRLLYGELDWIVMKALEKERARRYETASELARDVERYLADEPVRACPPSAVYRLGKFARRHKAALGAALTGLAALLLLVGVLAVSNRMIAAQSDAKAVALVEKGQALAHAEAQRQRADANFWKASLAVRDIMTWTALGKDGNIPPRVRKRFSDEAIKFYESLLRDGSPDPGTRYETGVAYRTLGMVHGSWGELEPAERCFRRGIAVLGGLAAEHPAAHSYRYQLGYAHREFGTMLQRAGRARDAEAAYATGIDVLETLLAELPNDRACMVQAAGMYGARGALYVSAGRADEAETAYHRAIELLRKAVNAQPSSIAPEAGGRVSPLMSVGHQQRLLAFAQEGRGRLEEAEQMLREAIGTFERARGDDPPTARHFIADSHRYIARVLVRRGRLDAAERELRQAIEIHAQRAEDPGTYAVADLENEWSAAYFDLGRLLIRRGRLEEAPALFARGLEIYPDEHQNWYQAAALYLWAGNGDGYRRACREMLDRPGRSQVQARDVALRTATACGLAPDAVSDFRRVEKLLGGIEAAPAGDRSMALAQALTAYRAGRDGDAIDWLTRFPAQPNGSARDASALAVLAMARHREGEAAQASGALAAARTIIGDNSAGPMAGGGDWVDRLHGEILCREAGALLGEGIRPSTRVSTATQR